MTLAAAGLLSCTGTGQSAFDPASVADASGEVTRVEPLSWWTGMQTPLQLLVNGAGIAAYDVRIEGGQGVGVKARHKADSPNYLFVDVEVQPDAEPGTYYLVFSQGERQFKVPYEIAARAEGSVARRSFTTADMIYLLMPDRFANSDASNDSTPHTRERADRSAFFGRHGGDLQGMIDHLDYIAGLGATAVWPTPLLLDDEPEGSYHGYACGDYYRIDPRFGSNELYREFVGKAHDHGLKVIMDIVTNHCGTGHWWMKDLPFRDWIHQFPEYTGTNVCFSTNMDPNASRYDLDLQESGWFVPSMPDMNLDNPYVLQYFKQWAVWWIEYAGLDGFRVDTYPYNEKVPMSEWCAAVRREYPGFNIVGECWYGTEAGSAYWQRNSILDTSRNSHLKSVMDFPLQGITRDAFTSQTDSWGGLNLIYDHLALDFMFADPMNVLNFLDNHDTDRFLLSEPSHLGFYKQAIAFLLTTRGIPQIYYGTEILMHGSKQKTDWSASIFREDFRAIRLTISYPKTALPCKTKPSTFAGLS